MLIYGPEGSGVVASVIEPDIPFDVRAAPWCAAPALAALLLTVQLTRLAVMRALCVRAEQRGARD